jgi:hypothetical protein
MTPRDLAVNRAEVLRIVAAGNCDFASARLMLRAMDLTAAALPAEPGSVHTAPITLMFTIMYL